MRIKTRLMFGDCLRKMNCIPDGSVDMVMTDPPYGTTACKWDSVIPFDEMWLRLNKLIKPNGAIVLFGSEPFSSALRMSNIKNYKYDWIWEKERGSNFASVKYQPFKKHEIVSIFSKKSHQYYPQMLKGTPYVCKQGRKGDVYGGDNGKEVITINKGERYPFSIIKFTRDRGLHPTQKPVALMEYLIKTYTKEGETVLDFCMGSGTTIIAAQNLNRNSRGIEKDLDIFLTAKNRIESFRTYGFNL